MGDPGDPLCPCKNCFLLGRKKHYDLVIEDGQKLSVEEARALKQEASFKPRGREKVIVIDRAERLSHHVQNALLKFLEEPPDFLRIFLLASHDRSFLKTVKSRALRWELISQCPKQWREKGITGNKLAAKYTYVPEEKVGVIKQDFLEFLRLGGEDDAEFWHNWKNKWEGEPDEILKVGILVLADALAFKRGLKLKFGSEWRSLKEVATARTERQLFVYLNTMQTMLREVSAGRWADYRLAKVFRRMSEDMRRSFI